MLNCWGLEWGEAIGGMLGVGGDREGIVVEDVMNDVNFFLVFDFFEAVGV